MGKPSAPTGADMRSFTVRDGWCPKWQGEWRRGVCWECGTGHGQMLAINLALSEDDRCEAVTMGCERCKWPADSTNDAGRRVCRLHGRKPPFMGYVAKHG